MPRRVIVVGGGISGLATAYYLSRDPGVDVQLLEASERLGGVIRTERHGGYVLEGGPDAIVRTKIAAKALCVELGLEDQLISPLSGAARVYMRRDGRLLPIPEGLGLGAPSRIMPVVRTQLLSWRGKLRMFVEPFIPRSTSDAEESVADFLTRRLGSEAALRLVGPLLEGVFSGRAQELSLTASFPSLIEFEKRYSSLLLGARAPGGMASLAQPSEPWSKAKAMAMAFGSLFKSTSRGAPPSPFLAFRDGLGVLVDRIAAELGDRVRTVAAVREISRVGSDDEDDENEWAVTLESGETLRADTVVLAVPAHVAARLAPSPQLRDLLGGIRFSVVAPVYLGFSAEAAPPEATSSGILIPEGEGRLLAVTFISSKWPGRAPDGSYLLRAFVGGRSDGHLVDSATDAELIALAREELEAMLGPLGEPELARVFRVRKGTPLPGMGYMETLRCIEEGFAAEPGLEWVSAGFGGIGIADCVRRGKQVAESIAAAGSPARQPGESGA